MATLQFILSLVVVLCPYFLKLSAHVLRTNTDTVRRCTGAPMCRGGAPTAGNANTVRIAPCAAHLNTAHCRVQCAHQGRAATGPEFLKDTTMRPYGRAKIFRDCATFGFLNSKMHKFTTVLHTSKFKLSKDQNLLTIPMSWKYLFPAIMV